MPALTRSSVQTPAGAAGFRCRDPPLRTARLDRHATCSFSSLYRSVPNSLSGQPSLPPAGTLLPAILLLLFRGGGGRASRSRRTWARTRGGPDRDWERFVWVGGGPDEKRSRRVYFYDALADGAKRKTVQYVVERIPTCR